MDHDQLDYMAAIYQRHAGLSSPEDYAKCATLIRTGLAYVWYDGEKVRPELSHAGRITLARHLDPESRMSFGLTLAEAS